MKEAPKFVRPPPTNIEVIVRSMQNINNMTAIIDQGNYSQKIKDDSKRIAGQAFDMVIHETSQLTINKLVMQEYRKKRKLE